MNIQRKWLTVGLLGVSCVLSITAMANDTAPIIDATASNPVAHQVKHVSHWYDGPLTSAVDDSSVSTADDTSQISSDLGQSNVDLPAITQRTALEGAAPTAQADQPTEMQISTQHLPPVINLNQRTSSHIELASNDAATTSQQAQLTAPSSTDDSTGDTASAASTSSDAAADTSNMSDADRLARLEQQVTNLTKMNLPQEIADLQQQVQKLSGQLQVLEHESDQLNNQQSSFYKDLDQRIQQLNDLLGSSADSVNLKNPSSDATSGADKSKTSTKSSGSTDKKTDASSQETSLYNKAIDSMTKKHYDAALSEFQAYLSQYPNGSFVINAHYWLGELYAVKQQNDNALKEFNYVVKHYPKSRKVADAQYKIAILHLKMGATKQAQEELDQIRKNHPNTTAAQLASIKLQQIQLSSGAS